MTFEMITSIRNPLIARLRTLKDKEGRDECGMLLIEGEKLLKEALLLGHKPGFLLYESHLATALEGLIRSFHEAGAEIHPVSDAVMGAVSGTKTPQGVCAAFRLPEMMRGFPDRLVALDGVQDPGNVGTIWRTADAAGFGGLILGPGSADPFSPKVQRGAMGSGMRLPVAVTDDLGETLEGLFNAGYDIVVSSLDGAPFYAHEALKSKYVLVIGSEAHGVSGRVQATATMKLKLPMRGGAESLNAGVAAGIMMYELTKNLDG